MIVDELIKNETNRSKIICVDSVSEKPKTTDIPNQAGMIASCELAARPINSLRPISSTVDKPAAAPTTVEIRKLTSIELKSLNLSGG